MRAALLLSVILLAACSSAPPASPDPSPTPEPSPTPAAAEMRLLASGLFHPGGPFSVAVAFSPTELSVLMDDLGITGASPQVDFGRETVLFLGMAGSSSCPQLLERLVVDHAASRVYGRWATGGAGNACTDDLAGQGLLLAVERAVLPDEPFLLSLQATPICADCPNQPDQLFVDPRATGD